MNLKYKRVLLKLSGESLSGKIGHGIDFDTVVKICEPIKKIVDMGCEVAIVVGGGNFWRGRSSGSMDRTRADHMGMLATVINALGVADGLEQVGNIVTAIDNYDFTANTANGEQVEIIAASVRSANHVTQCALMGADIATVPFGVLKKMVQHPLTDRGLDSFMKDWEKVANA